VPKKKYGHWDVEMVGEFNPSDHFGFVYQITHIETGKFYIGCKHLYKHKKSKRSGESNWKYYCSSSKHLQPDIKQYGKKAFTFQILMMCKNKRDLYYNEMRIQIDMDVLGKANAYNMNIGGKRFFRPVESYGEEFRHKISGINSSHYRGSFTITYTTGDTLTVTDQPLNHFAAAHGYDHSALYKVANGKRKHHKNIAKVEFHDKKD
jgi:hypothetical protein